MRRNYIHYLVNRYHKFKEADQSFGKATRFSLRRHRKRNRARGSASFSTFDEFQFHVVNRIYDRKFLLDREAKDLLLKLVRAYEDVCGVEVLT